MFSDVKLNLEDLMRAKGDLVKRGSINEEGNIEFWEDGSEDKPQNLPSSNAASSTAAD
jgi:protein import protein ZIM17